MKRKTDIEGNILKIVLNEVLFDIKALKGMKIIMLIFCIVMFPIVLIMKPKSENLRMLAIALPYWIAYCFEPKVSKIIYMIPINTKDILNYVKYKCYGMLIISSLTYLVVNVLVHLAFHKDTLLATSTFFIKDLPMIIILNAFILRQKWKDDIIKSLLKKRKMLIVYFIIVYFLNYGIMESETGVLRYILALLAYICSVLFFKDLLKLNKELIIEGYERYQENSVQHANKLNSRS